MNLLPVFIEFITRNQLFEKHDHLVIALSGGVDSVVLCELCRQAGFNFSVAHCNFQLRDEESERDEAFAKNVANKYGVRFYLKKFDTKTYASENKLSVQESARELRYTWFLELINAAPSKTYLLTAHHADDNAETVLMNFCRGTGLSGLHGIPVSTPFIRRPLLSITKKQVLDFARENNSPFVEDSSNSSPKYTRNLFRNEIMPTIEKVYPALKDNLLDNISRFKEIESLYKTLVKGLQKKLYRIKGEEIHIPVKQLMAFNNRALVYEIIREFDFSEKQVEEVYKLAESESGKYLQSPPGTYRIIRHRHWFIITPISDSASENIIIEENDHLVKFQSGSLNIEHHKKPGKFSETSLTEATLDASTINFPLLLRKWKAGDYFYPLGMRKKKKISRFLIDQKLSKPVKENTWVIESNKKIIWVVGQRIDDRFKITAQTKKYLHLAIGD